MQWLKCYLEQGAVCQHLQIKNGKAICFALALQGFHKDEFGNLLSSLSTVPFPDSTELNLGIGVDLNSGWRNPRFIQVEGMGVFSPMCSLVLKSAAR